MVNKKHNTRLVVCVVLVLTMLLSMFVCASAGTTQLSNTSADTYYFYGLNNNGPDFNSMSGPTGSFTYDSSLGYYYYDIESFSGGDYCFIISTSSSSGSQALSNQTVKVAAQSGPYYLQYGQYGGNQCYHIWNNNREPVRIYFATASSGVNAIALSSVGGEATQAPTSAPATQAPTTQTPTTSGGSSSAGGTVYCRNSAGWSTVNAYMWVEGVSAENKSWPGVKMTNIGDDVWQYDVPSDAAYNMIIFNNGSTQTSNLQYPGNGYIFDNKTNTWEVYDVSAIKVTSFTTDVKSPQYTDMDIVLSAQATSTEGAVSYKFSVIDSNKKTTVLSNFSSSNTAKWTPVATGTYTLKFEFKDTKGNTNERTMSYTIESDASLKTPVIKRVTPNGGQILVNKAQTVTVKAGGGNVGTSLLFYKYTVKDKNGDIVNVPYYTRNSSYSFTPKAVGTYTLVVSVQASDNSVDERTYTLNCVTSITDPTDPDDTPDVTEAPTQAPTKIPDTGFTLKGDSDLDGKVTILDATQIQRYLAKIIDETEINLANSKVDDDNKVTILDATQIQRYLAKLIDESEW